MDSTSSSISIPELSAGIVEGGEPQNTLTNIGDNNNNHDAVPWVTTQDLGTGMDEFATLTSFDISEPVMSGFEYVNPNLGYDSGYDNFFVGLSDEALNMLADQYL